MNHSVWSACEIIGYLTGKDWCRLSDIARDLDMDVTKVHRLITALVAQDFVKYDSDTHRYGLGLRFFTIAYAMSRNEIVDVSRKHAEEAAGLLNQMINIGVLSSDKTKMVHVFRVNGDYSSPPPKDVPLGRGEYVSESALGKILIAYLPTNEQESILAALPYIQYTPNSIISSAALRQALQDARRCGYALEDSETERGTFCIAFPIRNHGNRVVAAISTTMKEKPDQGRLEEAVQVLRDVSLRISSEL